VGHLQLSSRRMGVTSSSSTVEGALSWRIPLGVQLLPGILLGVGSLWLPPSPRLLYLKGQDDAGLRALKRLRAPEGEDSMEYDISPKDLVQVNRHPRTNKVV
jgi:hypothetical protein